MVFAPIHIKLLAFSPSSQKAKETVRHHFLVRLINWFSFCGCRLSLWLYVSSLFTFPFLNGFEFWIRLQNWLEILPRMKCCSVLQVACYCRNFSQQFISMLSMKFVNIVLVVLFWKWILFLVSDWWKCAEGNHQSQIFETSKYCQVQGGKKLILFCLGWRMLWFISEFWGIIYEL